MTLSSRQSKITKNPMNLSVCDQIRLTFTCPSNVFRSPSVARSHSLTVRSMPHEATMSVSAIGASVSWHTVCNSI